VKHFNLGDDLTGCHTLFFRVSKRQNTRTTVASLNSASVLLVGEDPAFLGDGGMINLLMARGKIQFEVAQDALDRSSIQFSSKFLSLAKAQPQAEGPRQLRVKIAPEYPTIAKQMNLKGAAQVEATVGRDGTVTDVRVLWRSPVAGRRLDTGRQTMEAPASS
jgi:outer membrane biosynthesis protein TonB